MSDSSSPFQSPAFETPLEPLDDPLDELEGLEDDDLDEEVDEEVDDEVVNEVSGGKAAAVLEHVAVSIVDEKDAVVVDVAENRGGVRLSLHVAPGDMGRVIGKRGRVAQAIRTLVRAAAARDGSDASVDIVD